jgi:phosphomethylpyrimidine synthase
MSAHETHPNSRKVYVGPYKVPVREIALSGGEPPLQVYDSSGPQGHDVRDGLPPLRRDWIAGRKDVQTVPRTYIPDSRRRAELPKTLFRSVLRGTDNVTQLHYARKGVITAEMEFIAAREGFDAEFVRTEVARGRAINTANIKHTSLYPMKKSSTLQEKKKAHKGKTAEISSI